jgi:type IV pilus assembly protein PilF
MVKIVKLVISLSIIVWLSGCVTQNYENDSPVIENDASNSEIALTRISLALGYLKIGNTEQAKLNLEKAKYFSPNLVQVHTAFAHYYETVGEFEQTIQAYDKALGLKPDDADTLNNYGVFLCRRNRIDDAQVQLLKAIAVPSYILVAKSYENLALCHLQISNFVQASQYLTKSISHSPNRAATLFQMSRLQYIMADYKAAQLYFQRFERNTRRFKPESLALAFKIYQKQGKLDIAKNYAAMLVKMFPSSALARQYLLNGLAEIEADKFAKNYQGAGQIETKTKKRVVVLSPDKTGKTILQSVVKTTTDIEPSKPSEKHVSSVNSIPVKTLPVYLVKPGDSLFSISLKYNIRMKSLQRWNKIKASNILRAGDVIHLANPTKAKPPHE